MKSIFSLGFVVLLCLGSCSKDASSTETNNIDVADTAKSLPLLNKTNAIGIIRGFNASNPPTTAEAIETAWNEALIKGMKIGRVQIDWPELEPNPNEFNKSVLEEELAAFKNDGLQPSLLISAYDSEGPVLPEDLIASSLDNTELITRFKKLMDWVIPMLVDYDGYLISISNEADANFAEQPILSSELLTFLKEIKSHIHSLNPKIAVTVTFAEGSLDLDPTTAQEIITECDVACFNFYGAKSTTTMPFVQTLTESEIKSDIQRMLSVAGNKNIVIQELGMHTDQQLLGSSDEIQRKFFEVFFTEMQAEERLKVANVFQLVDWSPETTELFRDFLTGDDVPAGFFESYATSLETVGLINYSNGNKKPAWNEFLKWLELFEN